ncbi:unnamed protein product, partial [Ectocarpus sp. 6 AP-2014]
CSCLAGGDTQSFSRTAKHVIPGSRPPRPELASSSEGRNTFPHQQLRDCQEMETRNSPSLHQLQRLARQAHIGAHDFSAMSKPALFGHLRANYDYNRLERAHHIALKRD